MNFIPKLALREQRTTPADVHVRTRRQIFYLCLVVFLLSPALDAAIRFFNLRWYGVYAPSSIYNAYVWLGFFRNGSDSGDSWNAMRAAFDWYALNPGGRLYQELFFAQHVKFQYPPSSLLLFDGLSLLGIEPGNHVLNNINWWIIGGNALVNGLFASELASRSRHYASSRVLIGVIVALATPLYYPSMKAFDLGQLQVWINMLFSLAALAWLMGRNGVAGVMIGVICLMKPQFALFAAWGLLRREWAFLIGWSVVALGGNLMALAIFGWQNHVDYLGVLSALSRTGESFIANQSFNGLLNRLYTADNPGVWQAHGFPAFHPVIYAGTLVTSLAMIAAALFLPLRRPGATRLSDFLCAALTFTLASPIAWEHHFGLLPVVYVAAMFALLVEDVSPRVKTWGLGLLSVSFLLTGHWLGGSSMFVGLLALLGVMHWVGYSARPPAASS